MDIISKSLNYLKSLTAETISNAKSGHTGSALGASSILLALFHDHLHFDASGTNWQNRDRFVLSAGHASALLYSLLHLFGYDISIEDLKQFRKSGSKTPGHPEYGVVPGVETTTGPLGQGIANAVGMAIAEAKMERQYPDFIDNYTYCYAGDGCLMEGVGVEACSLAGTLGLNKLILLYDDNNITIDGERTLANKENVAKKFEAMNWNVVEVKNGNDYHACSKAIKVAKKSSNKPTIIIFKTTIGIGTKKQGTCSVHAYPLLAEELCEFKKSLNVEENFYVPEDVYNFCHEATNKNNELIKSWNEKFEKDTKTWGSPAFNRLLKPSEKDFEDALALLNGTSEMAGRDASGKVLCSLSENNYFFGGTADLGPSTKAVVKLPDSTEPSFFDPSTELGGFGRNIHFGIREHAMGSIANGMALYNSCMHIFDSTFVAFSNYMLPALKMRAMMKAPVMSICSHDSIDIGEDGPTHQPIEQIPQLRLLIGLSVWRPGTYAEVVAAYKHFLKKQEPVFMAVTKNKISNPNGSTIESASKGGYVILENGKKPEVEIFATGREIYLAMEVAKLLSPIGVRVISLPCLGEFEKQDTAYKNKVLLKNPKLKIAIEATNDNIWHKYVGESGLIFNVDDYQTSGNGGEIYKKAGFDAEFITKQISKKISKLK